MNFVIPKKSTMNKLYRLIKKFYKMKAYDFFNEFSKEYYYQISKKMSRTKLEICSIYEYIIRDKLFLEMISDKELLAYFRECSTISEDIAKNVTQMKQMSLSNRK